MMAVNVPVIVGVGGSHAASDRTTVVFNTASSINDVSARAPGGRWFDCHVRDRAI
jgi:hypothetical protein